jgi:hypothetical protein
MGGNYGFYGEDMSWLLDSPVYILLALVFLAAAGYGFGQVTGKGLELWHKLADDPKLPPKQQPALCSECLLRVPNALPCKEHSGLTVGIASILRGQNELKAEFKQEISNLWSAMNNLRRELK